MNDKTWERIKYWRKKYTWPVSALIGLEYKNVDNKKIKKR
tara:strand:+ start:6506 stop:6625 length:120 start_codon:yes stop_codon:yes gene_type:complete